jgi:hypothetical protein
MVMKNFCRYLGGTALRPNATFHALQADPKRVSKSFKAILLIGVLYTITVVMLAAAGALITAPAFLALSPENYYFCEMFFALPVMVLAWILAAGFVQFLSRWGKGSGTFEGTLAALGFAVTVPFLLTWIPETAFAVLLHLGMRQEEFMDLWTKPGFLQTFALFYQIVAAVWIFLLITIAVGVSQKMKWRRAIPIGLLTTLLFLAVLIVFIR